MIMCKLYGSSGCRVFLIHPLTNAISTVFCNFVERAVLKIRCYITENAFIDTTNVYVPFTCPDLFSHLNCAWLLQPPTDSKKVHCLIIWCHCTQRRTGLPFFYGNYRRSVCVDFGRQTPSSWACSSGSHAGGPALAFLKQTFSVTRAPESHIPTSELFSKGFVFGFSS